MFSPTQIQQCLTGVIGFKQFITSDVERLEADLVQSTAGILIDQIIGHPLITADNIMSCAELYLKDNVATYDAIQSYVVGDLVLKNPGAAPSIYRCIQNSTGNDPAAPASAYWKLTNITSAYLRSVRDAAGINVFNAVFQRRKLNEVGKTLLTDTSLYEGSGSLTAKISKLGRFVYVRIKPKFRDSVVKISAVGLQLDTVNPAFKLYVYQSSSLNPVKMVSIAHNGVTTFAWNQLVDGLELRFNHESLDDDRYYYIGYYEDDLLGNAIWKQDVNLTGGCSTCNNVNSYLWRQWSAFFDIQPGYVTSTFINAGRTMFEEEKQILVGNQNWGMNLRIQVHCDVSDFICRNKNAFTEALKLQIVHDLLSNMAYSMRDNQRKEKVSQMAFYALENKENFESGIRKQLENAIKGVSFDISGISKVCLPCESASSPVKIKSVYK